MMERATLILAMTRGVKILGLSTAALFITVACVVGLGVGGIGNNSGIASRLDAAIETYRGGAPAPNDSVMDEQVDLRTFAQAYGRINALYVRPTAEDELFQAAVKTMQEEHPDPSVASDAQLVESALQGMMGALDDYSVYLSKDDFSKLYEEINGSFGGLGIEIRKHDLGLEVISPIDDTPAQRAGIQSGDKLTHADGVSLADMTLRDAVDLLRGPPGSPVELTVLRGDDKKMLDVSITREIIRIQRVRARLEDGGIAYLRITHFVRDTGEVLRSKMRELAREAGPNGLNGYVVDLRNNPGGLLDESIDVAGAFLSGGEVVSTRSRTEQISFDADLPNPSGELPVVVLINGGSASASEIVAGAIKYRDRGLVVGEKSFGKGSVQTTYEFRGGGGLKLTTALYYTPSGKTVEGGIEPSVEAIDDPETTEVDEALEIALSLVRDIPRNQALYWNSDTGIVQMTQAGQATAAGVLE